MIEVKKTFTICYATVGKSALFSFLSSVGRIIPFDFTPLLHHQSNPD